MIISEVLGNGVVAPRAAAERRRRRKRVAECTAVLACAGLVDKNSGNGENFARILDMSLVVGLNGAGVACAEIFKVCFSYSYSLFPSIVLVSGHNGAHLLLGEIVLIAVLCGSKDNELRSLGNCYACSVCNLLNGLTYKVLIHLTAGEDNVSELVYGSLVVIVYCALLLKLCDDLVILGSGSDYRLVAGACLLYTSDAATNSLV